METRAHVVRETSGMLYVAVDLHEYVNIESGKLRALVLVGSTVDDIDAKTLQVQCVAGTAARSVHAIDCVVKGVLSLAPILPNDALLASIQPVKHRQREVNRRKSYRSLHAAYDRLRTKQKKEG